MIEASQNSKFENLQLLLTNHVQSYYLSKEVLSVEDDAVNYRFTLDLGQILSAMVDVQQPDDVATKFTMMHQYTYTDEMTGEVREYDRSLRIPVRVNGSWRILSDFGTPSVVTICYRMSQKRMPWHSCSTVNSA